MVLRTAERSAQVLGVLLNAFWRSISKPNRCRWRSEAENPVRVGSDGYGWWECMRWSGKKMIHTYVLQRDQRELFRPSASAMIERRLGLLYV